MSSFCAAQVPAGWKSVSPGFSAEALIAHNKAMWAAGEGETIAMSRDAGRNWTTKHENRAGALLLSLAFVSDKFGYAAGTSGVVVFTLDGGESWTAKKVASDTILQAAFGDPEHGVIRTRSALLATTDGGKSWNAIAPSNDSDWSSKYPFVDDMAALDSTHLIVRVSEGEFSDGEFLWTEDGGATWKANYLPDGAGRGRIFIAEGQYWSIGHQVVDKDRPDGGYATPMAVLSKDGAFWDHQLVYREVCHWQGCDGCTSQGCFAGDSSFVPFSRILQDAPGNGSNPPKDKPESLDRFPAHLLSNQWARSGNSLCILTQGTLECTTLTPVATLDTKSESSDYDDASWPPLHPTRGEALSLSIEPALGHGIRCIRCTLLRTYFSSSEKGESGPTPFELLFVIGTSGGAESIKVRGPLPEDVANQIRQTARSWVFEPCLTDGVAKAVPVGLRGKIFVMNFTKIARPPQP